jgi:branched-chain amino acid transport system substrate-binding protein
VTIRKPVALAALLLTAIAALFAPAALAQPILIGQSAALTGAQAGFGKEMRDGGLAAFAEVNKRGGIHGRRVELITLDDAGNAERAKENALKLVGEHKVVALYGFISRPSSVAGAKVASESRIPFIGPFSGTPALYKYDPFVFTVRASYDDELDTMVKQLVMTGHKRIGFAFLSDARAVNVPLVEKLLAQHGLKPAVLIGLDRTSPDVKAQVKQLVDANPEVLLALANNVPLTALTREARKAGNSTPFWIVSFVDSSLMVKELGPLAQGQVFAQVVPLPTRRNMRVVKDYQRDYRVSFPNSLLSFTSLEGYIAARTLAEGLKRAGPQLTRERLARTMEAMKVDLGDFWIDYSGESHNGSRFVDLTIVNKDGQFLN